MGDSDEETSNREDNRPEKSDQQSGDVASEQPDGPIEIDGGENLKQIVFGHDIVLTNCYAEWCEHCRAIEPILEDVAVERDAVVANVDVEQNQSIARRLVDDELPRIVLFVQQNQVAHVTGRPDKETLERLLDKATELKDSL